MHLLQAELHIENENSSKYQLTIIDLILIYYLI